MKTNVTYETIYVIVFTGYEIYRKKSIKLFMQPLM